MIFQPAIFALLLSSALSSALLLACLPFAVTVLRRWDLTCGSEAQLSLEKRTYLVATVLKIVLAGEAAALVLFVFNADRMATLFTGAMCAVGTLRVDPFGFPALMLKMAVFFLAAVWLVLDHVDNHGWDYPLIKAKYAALLLLAPVMLTAAGIQLMYFQGLRADVITSCCSTLFSGGGVVVLSNAMASLPHHVSLSALAAVLAAILAGGIWFLCTGRGAVGVAALSLAALPVALAAIVSTVSVYVYELPHHHCPFCILKREYGHVGYALYLPLFLGVACGVGAGVAAAAARLPSLATPAPLIARRLVLWSLGAFALFAAVTVWLIARSHLILFEGPP